jgi:hypothetical protein
MDQEIFADGISSIVLEGGVMRIDLMSIIPGQRDKDSKPQMAFRQRIVMPVEGFINSYKIFQEIMLKMEQSGLIARQTVKSSGTQAAGESPSSAAQEKNEQV